MKVYTCTDDHIQLSPTVCSQPPTYASLSSRLGYAELTPNGYDIGPIPPELPDGVYQLHVDTPCHCFNAEIYLHRCEAPSFPSTHKATNPDPQIMPECCPDD